MFVFVYVIGFNSVLIFQRLLLTLVRVVQGFILKTTERDDMVMEEDIYERAHRRFQHAMEVAEQKIEKEIIQIFLLRVDTSWPASEHPSLSQVIIII